MSIHITACPRNCYSTCTLRVLVEDGRVRGIESHPENRATPEGVCLKGLSYVERVVSPDRILTPLARRPGTSSFERISWDEALDRIAERLLRLRETGGPQSVLYYAASGTKGLLNGLGLAFWRLYGGCTTTYGDLCWPAGLEATRLTLGANKHNAPWDLVNARLIVLWGKNAAETNVHQMPFVEKARDRGAKVVVIDPRRTETAEHADLLVQPRPGTDGALALAVGNRLVERNRVDRDFIARHVKGFPEYKEAVRSYSAREAEAITDVPAAHVERLAEYFAAIEPVTICAGYGMQRYTNSGQTMRAIIALLAVTGNLGRPGAGWQFANLQTGIFDSVPDPFAFYPPEKPDGVIRVGVSAARLGQDMLDTRDPALRMAWVERGNPATQNPETHTVLRAFRSLDFRVVVDQFLTDTAREADIVLPAKTFLEQSDVIGAYWHPYLQLKKKVIDPPGEVRPESVIYRTLAERLGIPPDVVDRLFPGPSDADVDAWLRGKLAPFPDLTLDRLRQGPVLAPGHQEIAFSDLVFPTPSGKIELLSEDAASRWGVDPLPLYTEPEESARRESFESSRYPLVFLTPNTKDRIHSQFGNLPSIRSVSPGPRVSMNPRDTVARGIGEGDRVRIFNDRGSLVLRVAMDLGVKPGCISVPNGWWIEEGGTVNFCSRGRETDMGHGAAFHDNLVQVERVP
jgi:anaerobic selenocysteine-containing dehydrogenase